MFGILDLSFWGYVATALVLTQITIAGVTIYLHRHQAHRALELHPVVSHFFRFWLWLTTGIVTREWVAIHRKHHARCETRDDPHSPQVLGIDKVLWQGAELYRAAAQDREMLEQYGHATPDDWLERHLYTRYSFAGISILLVLSVVLFGIPGISIWALQMLWIPLWAAGVINGLGHFWGYRNYECRDASTNLVPWGAFIGGEELHNNHHAYPSSARFSSRPWELDIGWLYIRLLSALGLARVQREAPRPVIVKDKKRVDIDTVKAMIGARMHVMARYYKMVVLPVFRLERDKADASCRSLFKRAKQFLVREESRMDAQARHRLHALLDHSQHLQTVFQFRQRLQVLWNRKAGSQEALLPALQEWCKQAEATGISALQEFARSLRGYTLQPA